MSQIAKIFMTGRSQAVRLPAEFHFDSKEVFIRRDPVTGDVVLSRKPSDWEDFFRLQEASDIQQDYLADRGDQPAQPRELF
jgi:antitoxin VapB